MSITGPGSVTAATVVAQTNMMTELNSLAQELGTGQAAQTYSGLQSQAANAATNLQQGQDTVLTALQQRFNSQSGVNIDTEMSNLIALQNAYGANARVMTTIQQMMSTLIQSVT